LEKEVINRNFREDLYFRLNVIHVTVPPLRKREGDLRLLADYFLEKYSLDLGKDIKKISAYAMDLLQGYSFPGNVRELENIIQRAIALSDTDIIRPEHLPADIQHFSFESVDANFLMSLEEMEKRHIVRVLELTGYDRQMTSAILGLPRTTLWRKMKKYGLND
jgi:transcriptional regulator with PAS, ATPase and Fis domain